MRIAQLGAGRIGAMHAESLSRLLAPGELVLADLDAERARTLAATVGAETASVEEAIAGADALVIAASSNAHPELLRAGIDRGLPIFCEKPLATTVEETTRLVDEIEASPITAYSTPMISPTTIKRPMKIPPTSPMVRAVCGSKLTPRARRFGIGSFWRVTGSCL